MYAVIKTGGKQYRVSEGDIINVEKYPSAEGKKKIKIKEVLMIVDGDNVTVGTPYVKNATVVANAIEDGKSEKVIVYKYKRKKDYRRKQGHRQPYTKLEISKISIKAEKKTSTDSKQADKSE
jgi:large subunit ribosomal protein L21